MSYFRGLQSMLIMDKKISFQQKQSLLEHLLSYATQARQDLFYEKIKFRTRYLTVVLEDIYQAHNASAVLRSCDCLGIQDVHIIENGNSYEVNPDVALGSSKWLSLIWYNQQKHNTALAYGKLRADGYRIIATTPHKNEVMLDELSIDQKTALVFGTELTGLSQDAISLADGWVKIPMVGFTESFNISVAASISLFHLSQKIRNSNLAWQLCPEEELDIMLGWVRQSVKSSRLIEEKFVGG